jgi:4-amino-4-deoxy-L-arabinose transferase-like glycosyltransferase
LLLGATLLAGLLRVYGLGDLPLWIDEAWSEWFAHRRIREVWSLTVQHDTHPPLYHALLSGWIALFGNSEAALRSLSVAFSVATVPIVYLLGRTIAPNAQGLAVGLIAAFLFALAPLQVDYAQEARSYAALSFAVALMLYGACCVLREHASPNPAIHPDERTWTRSMRSPGWWALVAGSALALWLHNTAALVVASTWMTMLIAGVSMRRTNPMLLRGLLTAGLVVASLYAPFLPYLVEQVGRVSDAFWVATPSVTDLEKGLLFLFGNKYGHTIIASLAFCAVGTLGFRSLCARENRWTATLLVVAMLAPILLEFGLSRIGRPIFLPRTLIYTLIPFFVFVAAGVTSVRSVSVRCLMAAGLAATLLSGLQHYYVLRTKEPWDRFARVLLEATRDEDVVFTIPNFLTMPLRYYLPDRTTARGKLFPLPGEFPTSDKERSFPIGINGAPRIEQGDLEQIRQKIPRSGGIWLVMRNESFFDREALVAGLLRDEGFREVLKESSLGITLSCFERVGASDQCSR